MKLLLIITDYGSFNNFLSELSLSMIESGNEVDVICSDEKIIDYKDKAIFSEKSINLHFMPFPRGFNPFKQLLASIHIYNLVKQIKPDLVHINFTTGIFTSVFYKKLPYKTMGTIHGLGFPMMNGVKKHIFKMIELFCFKRLDQIWVLNNFDYDIITGKNKSKTFLLNSSGLGCDLNRFDIDKYAFRRIKIKEELRINEKDFVITFTGRFVHFKGFDKVIRSFLKLNELYPSTYKLLLIGGNDPIHSTGLTPMEVQEYLNCNQIIQIGFSGEVEKYLAISDVFLFPSLKEGMPVCIIEALAMGVPVVTADSRGCNDLIIHRKNGLLLSKKSSVEEIVDAVSMLKNSPSLLLELSNFALKHRSRYGRDIYLKKQIEIYEEFIEL